MPRDELIIKPVPSFLNPFFKVFSKSPPCAPIPAIKNGVFFVNFLKTPTSSGQVAPISKNTFGYLPFQDIICFATFTYKDSFPTIKSWKSPAEGLEVLQITKTPLSLLLKKGSMESNPQ